LKARSEHHPDCEENVLIEDFSRKNLQNLTVDHNIFFTYDVIFHVKYDSCSLDQQSEMGFEMGLLFAQCEGKREDPLGKYRKCFFADCYFLNAGGVYLR
jgi:hypothetical protein